MPISVLILTLNEEINLPGCLESVSWCDDIVVFDSFSSDRTVEIAKEFGTRVFQRKFDNYAAQRNAALNEVEYKNSWVLMVDADERISNDIFRVLENEIGLPENKEITLFHLRRWDYFLGSRIPISTWFGRLVKLGHVTVEREINEEYHTNGKKGYIPLRFTHYPLNKGLEWWFSRHNKYSSMEANRLIQERKEKLKWKGLLSTDSTIRRKYVKQLLYRMPFRPLVCFLGLYIIKYGFIYGRAGLAKAKLRYIYEHLINLKIAELRQINKTGQSNHNQKLENSV